MHIIGHSMGGLIARYYVQRLGGDAHVHTVVHARHAALRHHPGPVRALAGDPADALHERDHDGAGRAGPGCRTRFVAIWSDLDQLVLPQRNARIQHPDLRARNVLIRGIGHMSLPVDRRVVHEISTALAQLDHDGSQLASGGDVDREHDRPAAAAGYSFSTGAYLSNNRLTPAEPKSIVASALSPPPDVETTVPSPNFWCVTRSPADSDSTGPVPTTRSPSRRAALLLLGDEPYPPDERAAPDRLLAPPVARPRPGAPRGTATAG